MRRLHCCLIIGCSSLIFVESIFYGLAYRGTGDAWLHSLPLLRFAVDSLARGSFPLWNPFLASGYNFLGDPANMSFEPSTWLLIPFTFSKAAFFAANSIRLWLFLSGVGLLSYFGLSHRVTPLAAVFASLSIMLSPAAVWALSQQYLFPGVFYATWVFYLILTAESRVARRNLVLQALAVALVFLGSNLIAAIFLWLSLFALSWTVALKDKMAAAKQFLISTSLGLGIACARLLPQVIAALGSNRIRAASADIFLKKGALFYAVRSLVPEYLGWNQNQIVAPFDSMSLEFANLSYPGLIAFFLALIAFLANGKLVKENRVLLITLAAGFLFQLETPFVYQFFMTLFSPLISGETLFVNFLFPLITGYLIAIAINSLSSPAEYFPALITYRKVVFGLALVLTVFLPFVSGFISMSEMGLILKLFGAGCALAFGLHRFGIWKSNLMMFILLGVLVIIAALAMPATLSALDQDFPSLTQLYFINSHLVLVMALTWILSYAALPTWKWQATIPLAITIALLIFASEASTGALDAGENPLLQAGPAIAATFGTVKFLLLAILCGVFIQRTLGGKWTISFALTILLLIHAADLVGQGKNAIAIAAYPFKNIKDQYPDLPAGFSASDSRYSVSQSALQGMIDNEPAWYQIRTGGGYLNLVSKEYAEAGEAALGQAFPVRFRLSTIPLGSRFSDLIAADRFLDVNLNERKGPPANRASLVFNAEVIPDSTERLHRLADAAFSPNNSVILEEGASLPGNNTPAKDVQTVQDTFANLEFHVNSDRPGFFLLKESFDRGWSARLNGNAVDLLKANHAFMGVSLPAGDATVSFYFWPRGLTLGLLLSAISLLFSLALFCFAEVETKKKTT